jgi:ectoine hydroxylase-related dioxygenase (phytanoyl-CoA dioxygenase family)
VASLLLRTLPAAAQAATGWREPPFLFNEHFVQKDASSREGPANAHFLWHRDAENHLANAETEEEAHEAARDGGSGPPRKRAKRDEQLGERASDHYSGPPPRGAAELYVTAWLALDATTRANGTLVLLPRQAEGHDATGGAARPCGEKCERRCGVAAELAPGDLLLLAPDVFHTSKPNATTGLRRRVHCTQYSRRPIVWRRDALSAALRRAGAAEERGGDGGGSALPPPPPVMFAIATRGEEECDDPMSRFNALTVVDELPRSATEDELQRALAGARASSTPLIARGAAQGMPAVEQWRRGDGAVAAALAERGGDAAVRMFVSSSGFFHLDGTMVPAAILTASMAREVSLRDFLAEARWANRYIVEDIDSSAAVFAPLLRGDAADRLLRPVAARAAMRQLFVTCGSTRTQLHRDAPFDNLYVCLAGRRTFAIAHAGHALELEPGGVSAALQPEGAAGTRFARVRFESVQLEPGDVFWLPAGWWHAVSATSDAVLSAACNWYFEPGEIS